MASEDDPDGDSPLEEVAVGAVIALTFLVGFGLLAVGYPWFWVAFPVGFAGCIPLAVGLVRLYESRREAREEADASADALESLRERYARGEIDETEFEERVELLLETESVTEARAYAARREVEQEREAAGERTD